MHRGDNDDVEREGEAERKEALLLCEGRINRAV